jgi:hypothetical protein
MRRRHLVDRSPVDEAGQWSEQLKNQLGDAQVANIRECLNRQRPFGQSNGQEEVAPKFELGS